jgi:hypothetical protein
MCARIPLSAALGILALALLVTSRASTTATAMTIAPSLKAMSEGSTSGTSLNTVRPASAEAGDVLVAVVAARVEAGVSITGPSDWALVRRDSNDPSFASLSQATYTHVVTSSDPSSYTWTLSAPSTASVRLLDYVGVDTGRPV